MGGIIEGKEGEISGDWDVLIEDDFVQRDDADDDDDVWLVSIAKEFEKGFMIWPEGKKLTNW